MIYKVEEYRADTCNNRWLEGKSCFVEGDIDEINRIIDGMPKGLRGFYVTPCEILDITEFEEYMKK